MIAAKNAEHFSRGWYVRSMNLLRLAWRSPRYVAVALITMYRWTISPLLGNRCKYHPSCSQYALDALREYGLVKGSILERLYREVRAPRIYEGTSQIQREIIARELYG